jgi:hypothetical protein
MDKDAVTELLRRTRQVQGLPIRTSPAVRAAVGKILKAEAQSAKRRKAA